jgi:hypothetical protein
LQSNRAPPPLYPIVQIKSAVGPEVGLASVARPCGSSATSVGHHEAVASVLVVAGLAANSKAVFTVSDGQTRYVARSFQGIYSYFPWILAERTQLQSAVHFAAQLMLRCRIENASSGQNFHLGWIQFRTGEGHDFHYLASARNLAGGERCVRRRSSLRHG